MLNELLFKKFINFKFLWNNHVEVQIPEHEIRKRFSELPEYIVLQRDKHIGCIKIVSTILLGINSSAMLFLLKLKMMDAFLFLVFTCGLFFAIISFVLIYGFHCDTYKSTIDFGIGKSSFNNFIQYEYYINSKMMKWEVILIILSFSMFVCGIFTYMK